jgi:tripartite-type tricarboxylate transporter receptor subunit TctC
MPQYSRRRFVHASSAAAALATLGAGGRAGAQGKALETTRIVTGFPPGGTSDTLCRRVAEGLRGSAFVKTALVENKAGAGGQIAVQSMKGAATDGSVILQTPASMLVIYPHIYKKLAYTTSDVTAVTLASEFEFGLTVGPAVPAAVKTVPDFLAWAKANPGQANFGSPAAGSVPHFIGVLLGQSAGLEMKHVPYRGSQPAMQDLLGGQLQAVSSPIGDAMPHLAGGKARMLGVSGAKRSRFVPDVPTYVEQGLKDMVFSEWFGFFVPAGTDTAVVMRANEALRKALGAKDVTDGLAVMGLETISSTPEELAIRLKSDLERWGPIVRKIGFTADS